MNIDEILLQVEKPARYIGREVNMVVKDLDKINTRFALCFPDVYEIGMSHIGSQILYFLINEREDAYCERSFAPWVDMEQKLREYDYKLFSVETSTPLNEFDFVGFTLQYEMSYSNIINMLDLSGIPIWSKDRGEDSPIVIAGGPCAYNPEPMADIIDLFYIGEGEVNINAVIDVYEENKKNGGTRDEFLEKACGIEGIYVPKFYEVDYNEDGTIKSFVATNKHAKSVINKVVQMDLENSYYPTQQLVPLIEIVHDRVANEIFRGCIRGCRFCQAGYVYRPAREKSSDKIIEQCDALIKSTGHEEVSLLSLSTADYSDFNNLADGVVNKLKNDKLNISIPSLRIDAFNLDLMEKVQGVRKSSLTFAPEAGTQRLRDVINKGIDENEILDGSYLAFSGGWNKIKLYFMIGLPTETEEDLKGIVDLSENIIRKYYELPKEIRKGRQVGVVVSTSCFVPKPFTAFQWEAQDDYTTFMEKQRFIKSSFNSKQVRYNYHDAKMSVMEGVIARGDRRLTPMLVKAVELGARFDGWSEHFNYETWVAAMEQCNIDMAYYTTRVRGMEEILPWDFININIPKAYFKKEAEKAREEVITPNCRENCSNCGAKRYNGGVCFEA